MAENASFDVLIDKIRPAVFFCRRRQEKKERKGKERAGKGREGIHKVTRRYISAILGAGTIGLIPIKFGRHVAPSNVINMSSFYSKIFRGFRSTGGQNPHFPIDVAGHCYDSAAGVIVL